MSLGTMIFDEILCDISRITLEHGVVMFHARSRARFTGSVDTDADVTIIAPDDSIIAHTPSVARGKHPNPTRDGYIYVAFPIDITHIHSRTDSDNNHITLEHDS